MGMKTTIGAARGYGLKKLILTNFQSPGDIVMLTAIIRDLHALYPGRFVTDVRTPFPELWEGNPYLTDLDEDEAGVQVIPCSYPMITQSNHRPYHFICGFGEFLGDRLGIRIQPTRFQGDIHLTAKEMERPQLPAEVARLETDYWLVVSGGKYDYTIKWWDSERYQRVVDQLRGRILFLQVGREEDYHPGLNGVIDLVGKTDLRELVNLVYHASGVLTPTSLLMHLAAAVPCKPGFPSGRACVVIAGGREPPHWEAYPSHQFIHRVGALSCCERGGCWKSRTFPLGIGDEKDRLENLCSNTVGSLPRCMDMIGADEVIARIDLYYQGGSLRYASGPMAESARVVSQGSGGKSEPLAEEPVHRQNALIRAERFIAAMPPCPDHFSGRGIVICAGGAKYFPCAWVCINMLRELGCKLPIQLWYLGPLEMDGAMRDLVVPLGVSCIDARAHLKSGAARDNFPQLDLGGWQLKPYAILHGEPREVLLLDADNVPVVDPEYLFDTPRYLETGALFWPDYGRLAPGREIWDICGVRYRDEPEFESGQILVDKTKCWRALQLSMWYNQHSDFFYNHIHGDKDTFHMAFRKLKQDYAMPSTPIFPLEYTMCQHDFEGERVFQHRNLAKWQLRRPNLRIHGFRHEETCLKFLDQLATRWSGEIHNDDRASMHWDDNLKELATDLSKKVFQYHRIGFDSRLMSFKANGLVGQGKADNEVYWDLRLDDDMPVLEIGSTQRATCLLKRNPAGVWQGKWLRHEKMPVELVPASPGDPMQ